MAEDEKPQIETPEVKEPEKKPESEVDSLLSELKRFGLEKPEQIKNIYQASQQTGRAWNEVGELRKEVDRLTQALQSQPQKQYEPDYGENQPIDLSKAIREGIRAEVMEMQKMQSEGMKRYYQELNSIQSDEDYPVVGELFEKHISNPKVAMNLQSGMSSLRDEYAKVNRTYYRELLKRTSSVLEKQAGVRQKPPHVEQGETQSFPLPSEDDERKENKKRIVKNRQSGIMSSDQALDALVKEFLPADDPIWQPKR